MLMCPKCGGIAYRNSYFGRITCRACGWKTTIASYEKNYKHRNIEEDKEQENAAAAFAAAN